MESCTFIPASELDLSSEGWEDISNSSNITFGDANRTMYTCDRLLMHVDFEDSKDRKKIKEMEDKFGPETYIDLEN